MLSTLRQYINDLTDMEQMLSHLENIPHQQAEVKTLTQEIQHAEVSLQKYRQLLSSLYEDYHEGLLNKDEYLDLKESYQEQVNELSAALDNMTTQQDGLTAAFMADTSHIDEFRKYMESPVLNRKMLVSMVKRYTFIPKTAYTLFSGSQMSLKSCCISCQTLFPISS